ncbi:hypothetical protein QE152_g38591 [Popillia japonica]|uniref:Pectinesterase n=1 Tax=Popillia japonica TaxID=7064 RepID=A0AAW1HW72_POPJA
MSTGHISSHLLKNVLFSSFKTLIVPNPRHSPHKHNVNIRKADNVGTEVYRQKLSFGSVKVATGNSGFNDFVASEGWAKFAQFNFVGARKYYIDTYIYMREFKARKITFWRNCVRRIARTPPLKLRMFLK